MTPLESVLADPAANRGPVLGHILSEVEGEAEGTRLGSEGGRSLTNKNPRRRSSRVPCKDATENRRGYFRLSSSKTGTGLTRPLTLSASSGLTMTRSFTRS